MHIPKPMKIGGLLVGCLATAEQAGEYLRMAPQPALQHVMLTVGLSVTAVGIGMFNTNTLAPIEQSLEPLRPVGATHASC